ncbi:hypothetical protein CEXT_151281 [Caerostris extrusa]|uniref:Uncharacterized protein n=1 Tax=Caerostris extrusa TaxID=172846 RepID=A0AAV4SDD9_CAEEX|nr:hypothetical protein CEXT_151281 [Caerostris extrusa]
MGCDVRSGEMGQFNPLFTTAGSFLLFPPYSTKGVWVLLIQCLSPWMPTPSRLSLADSVKKCIHLDSVYGGK